MNHRRRFLHAAPALIALAGMPARAAGTDNAAAASGSASTGRTPPIWPKPNPYLSAREYAIAHFDPAQTDTFSYPIPKGEFRVDLSRQLHIPGGPINIMTLASARPGFMWAVSSNRVGFVDARNGGWKLVAEKRIPGAQDVSAEGMRALLATRYANVETLTADCIKVVGPHPTEATGNGLYTVVDADDTVYANARSVLHAFALVDRDDPAKGIHIARSFDIPGVLRPLTLPGSPPVNQIVGLGMTYDGHLVVGSPTGVAVVDRGFRDKPAAYSIEEDQFVSNSFAIDDRNGIYLASGSFKPRGDGIMRKLVWTGTRLSENEVDGAWSSPYDGGDWPPAIKSGTGTGATPTLMGFAEDENRFVVITDGADRMKIVAFWRDRIPADFVQKPGTKSRRIADQMPITAGLPASTKWVQSEQSVVVNGFGAFVVNNVVAEGVHDKLIGVLAMGPLLPPATGVERVEWHIAERRWKSVWTRSDVVSISTVPAASASSGIVIVNGYTKKQGWEITGLDWSTGKNVTRVLFGHDTRGNGAYSILQFLEGDELLFNSIGGPYRIPLGKV